MLIVIEAPIGSTAVMFVSPFMVDVLKVANLGDFWDNVGDAVDITGGTIDAVELNDSTLTGCTISGYAPLNGDGNLVGTFIPRKGTASAINAIVLEEGELAYTTDHRTIRVGDGSTSGGRCVAQADGVVVTLDGSGICNLPPLPMVALVRVRPNSGTTDTLVDFTGMRTGQQITFVLDNPNSGHDITFPGFTNNGPFWGTSVFGPDYSGDANPRINVPGSFITILKIDNGGSEEYVLMRYMNINSA